MSDQLYRIDNDEPNYIDDPGDGVIAFKGLLVLVEPDYAAATKHASFLEGLEGLFGLADEDFPRQIREIVDAALKGADDE